MGSYVCEGFIRCFLLLHTESSIVSFNVLGFVHTVSFTVLMVGLI